MLGTIQCVGGTSYSTECDIKHGTKHDTMFGSVIDTMFGTTFVLYLQSIEKSQRPQDRLIGRSREEGDRCRTREKDYLSQLVFSKCQDSK